MATFTNQEGITFNDVLLVPQYSMIKSRADVDVSSRLSSGILLDIPIISSNMDTVTEVKMAIAMKKAGGLGILHRYAPEEIINKWIIELCSHGVPAIPSVGIKDEDLKLAVNYVKNLATAICVDVAHGQSNMSMTFLKNLSTLINVPIVAGNVATYDGAIQLAEAGAKIIKVGIGGGAACTTRVVTGHGVPQLSAIMECAKVKHVFPDVKLIADGGITNSGDLVKAIAAGADAVMLGHMLAGSRESCAPIYLSGPLKIYRGMASAKAQIEHHGKVNNDTPEGELMTVSPTGPVSKTLEQLVGGLRSGMSYSGCRTIAEFQSKAKFMRVSGNTTYENGAHGKEK